MLLRLAGREEDPTFASMSEERSAGSRTACLQPSSVVRMVNAQSDAPSADSHPLGHFLASRVEELGVAELSEALDRLEGSKIPTDTSPVRATEAA